MSEPPAESDGDARESAPAHAPSLDSMRPASTRRVASAAVIEVVSYVVSVALRLGSNLILTRLLFPEAFGLMALFQSIAYVIWMLSDVGITQAVVMSKRGGDPLYLDTAFTMQAVRGLGLWGVSALLAWPLSLVFREPQLLWILPIGSAAAALHGLSSTRIFTLRRQVRPLPLLGLDLANQLVALVINVGGAYYGYGVKALVAGQVVGSLAYAAASHVLPGSTHKNRFRVDPEAKREILHFGRWIFFSSALTSVALRGDQLLLARLLGAAKLGFYNIALSLAEMPDALIAKVINGAVYPALARVRGTDDPKAFADTYYRIRVWLDPIAHVGLGALIALAHWIIDLLYDDRYAAASDMLVVLAVRTAIQVLATFCETCFLAHGESNFSFRRNLFVSCVLLVAMPVGSYFGGVQGVLWGSVAARSMALVVLWPEAYRRGFLRPLREAVAIPYLALGYALGKLLEWILPNV